MKDLNFGKSILKDRSWKEVGTDEVLESARDLLGRWMDNTHRLERPKLYDHYALLLVALIDKVQELEEKVQKLENKT